MVSLSCKTQEYSQSKVLLDPDVTSMRHVYWFTDADEINSFGHMIPNFGTLHFVDRIEAVRSVP